MIPLMLFTNAGRKHRQLEMYAVTVCSHSADSHWSFIHSK